MRRPNTRSVRLALALTAASVAALAAGCYYEGGPLYSTDRFTYASTFWQPKTMSLVDTRTGQTLWSVDIPVGKQLVVDFVAGKGSDNLATPDLMYWEVMDVGTRFGQLDNVMPVPPANARRLDMRLRPEPELPPEMLDGGPVAEPVIQRRQNELPPEP